MPSEVPTSALHEMLADRLAAKGWSVEHLAKLSGLPESALASLLSGDPRRMPSAPYLHGYCARIAPLLDIDAAALLEAYRADEAVRRSGPRDELPKNRYAL